MARQLEQASNSDLPLPHQLLRRGTHHASTPFRRKMELREANQCILVWRRRRQSSMATFQLVPHRRLEAFATWRCGGCNLLPCCWVGILTITSWSDWTRSAAGTTREEAMPRPLPQPHAGN